MGGHEARRGQMINVYEMSVGKVEDKRPHGRPRRRWEDNIRMDLMEVAWEGVDRMHLA